jgi:starch synthase
VYVVMVAPECAPAAKAGGLGDVVSGLSRELELRGNTVEIILPKYASMRYSDIWDLEPSYRDLWVPWYGERVNCTVWFGFANGRKCFFIEPHSGATGGMIDTVSTATIRGARRPSVTGTSFTTPTTWPSSRR